MHLRILQASLVARVGARSAHNDTQKHEQKHANLLQVASGSSYHRSASPADFAFDSGAEVCSVISEYGGVPRECQPCPAVLAEPQSRFKAVVCKVA